MLVKDSSIFVAGHTGLVGSALMRLLEKRGFSNVITVTRDEVDLRDQKSVYDFFDANQPEFVFVAAGTVGGIGANAERPAEFLYDNMMISASVIEAANRTTRTQKLLYLASSSAYPRNAPQPVRESALLTGPLEPTNEGYALAEIIGLKLCETYRKQYARNFVTVVPTNLYGPNDNFDSVAATVIPGLMRRFHEAKLAGESEVSVWGSGSVRREFLYVDDFAEACVEVMNHYDQHGHLNIGSGSDVPIRELAELVRDIVHPEATLRFDQSKPDGIPRKFLEASVIRDLGWKPTTNLRDGIEQTYAWFCAHLPDQVRGVH